VKTTRPKGTNDVAAGRPHHQPPARRQIVTALEAPRLSEEVEVAVWNSVGAFVLDLTDVTFLDSSGLHALLRARAYLAREDRSLVLVCPAGPARRVLDLARVLDTFIVYPSAEAAANALVPADK
jgi:anti-anti-sigma factor